MLTVYYIGDSTVARNNIHSYPQTGMSQGLELYVKESVRIESHAKNGRSTKSFLDEGRFVPVAAAMKQGDILLIQFGHNDEKADPARHTDPYGDFQGNLRLFIQAAREKAHIRCWSRPSPVACSMKRETSAPAAMGNTPGPWACWQKRNKFL